MLIFWDSDIAAMSCATRWAIGAVEVTHGHEALAAGWVPTGIAYGISVAIRHDDWRTQSQLSYFAGNTEVAGYTELMNHVRADARRDFGRLAARMGGDSALMSSIWHHVWEYEAGENHRDHIAECVITGNAIARFHTEAHAITTSLSILPLRRMR